MNTFHHLHAWLLKRQADQLLQRADADMHRQSAHQTGCLHQPNREFEIYGSGWFALATIAVAFGAGYVVADDKRIERDQQDQRGQLSALCAKPWPDAPGAIEARRRACSVKQQS